MENVDSSRLLIDLVEHLKVIFYVFDVEKRSIVTSFGNVSRILGCYPAEELTFPLELAENLHHPDDRNVISHCLEQIGSLNGKCWSGSYRIKHFDGDWRWVYSKISSQNSEEHLLAGMLMDFQPSSQSEFKMGFALIGGTGFQHAEKIKGLTPRELMIIKMIAKGHSYTDIAERLFIQPDTVNKHRKNILRKLELKNIAMLACFAKESGLI